MRRHSRAQRRQEPAALAVGSLPGLPDRLESVGWGRKLPITSACGCFTAAIYEMESYHRVGRQQFDRPHQIDFEIIGEPGLFTEWSGASVAEFEREQLRAALIDIAGAALHVIPRRRFLA